MKPGGKAEEVIPLSSSVSSVNFLELCRKFIAIDTSGQHGTEDLVLFISQISKQEGLVCEIVDDPPLSKQQNIIVRSTQGGGKEIVALQAHLDTADPGDFGLWTKTASNPFNAIVESGRIFGLGASNSKLDFLCKWEALRRQKDRSVGAIVVGTCGREQGCGGAVRLMRKRKIRASRMLIGEPTELKLWHACKGEAHLEICIPFSEEENRFKQNHNTLESATSRTKVFSGKNANNNRGEEGESAIVKMFEFLNHLPDGIVIMDMEGGTSVNTVPQYATLEFDVVGTVGESVASRARAIFSQIKKVTEGFQNFKDERFRAPEATINIGMIRTFENHVKISGCCCVPPDLTEVTYQDWIQKVRNICDGQKASFNLISYKAPFLTSLDSPFVKECQRSLAQSGLKTECETMNINNEASVFSRFGIECLVFGAGKSSLEHPEEENVSLGELQQAISFYEQVIRGSTQ